jgi:uncharacterized protein (TIGR02246 family)
MTDIKEEDRKELLRLMSMLSEGWNTGRGQEFVRPMAEDVHFVAFDGSTFDTAAGVSDFHQPAFDTHLSNTRLEINVTGMRALSSDAFAVFATGGVVKKQDGTSGELMGYSAQTFICERFRGVLQITSFQNTRVRPLKGREAAIVWRTFDTLWNAFGEPGASGKGGPPAFARK